MSVQNSFILFIRTTELESLNVSVNVQSFVLLCSFSVTWPSVRWMWSKQLLNYTLISILTELTFSNISGLMGRTKQQTIPSNILRCFCYQKEKKSLPKCSGTIRKTSKTHKRLKEHFLIGRNWTKRANFSGSPFSSYVQHKNKQYNLCYVLINCLFLCCT